MEHFRNLMYQNWNESIDERAFFLAWLFDEVSTNQGTDYNHKDFYCSIWIYKSWWAAFGSYNFYYYYW